MENLRLRKTFIFLLLLHIVFLIWSFYLVGRVRPAMMGVGFQELTRENEQLRGMLDSLHPKGVGPIYEEDVWDRDKGQSVLLAQDPGSVLEEGVDIPFEITFKDPRYLRPVYHPQWRDFYFRGWLSIPLKIAYTRHQLFLYEGGSSNVFDFEGHLALERMTSIDYHHNLNFLVYNSRVQRVKIVGNQLLLIGHPHRKGIEIVSIKINDVFPGDQEERTFLVQLVTPGGYLMDEGVWTYQKTPYVNDNKEEEEWDRVVIRDTNQPDTYLTEENRKLREELSYYIPLNGTIITPNQYRLGRLTDTLGDTVDFQTVRGEGRRLEFEHHYANQRYRRPVYHPSWKKNNHLGWSYLPKLLSLARHRLFVIPEQGKEQADFWGQMAFYEIHQPLNQEQQGFLVYNFTVKQVFILNNQILIRGEPKRLGVEIISISRQELMEEDYIIHLATPDDWELDYEVLQVKQNPET